MNYWILFEQLLVLLAMMATGYIAYSVKIIDDKGYSQLSSLVVRILNPFLMISGVLGKRIAFSSAEIGQNINFVLALYSILFLLGFVYVRLIRCIDNRSYLLRMLILLPNVGFMGIPLVKEILGAEYIVLVAFYILGFNLIAYTYGIHLSAKYGGKNAKFSLKTLFNPGVICAVLAIIIFAYHIVLPSPVASFINYLGESCIVLSMIVVGAFLAKTDLKQVFINKQNLLFVFVFMFLVPLIMVVISKKIQCNTNIAAVFGIMACMPVGSATCMFAQEYGGDGTEAAYIVASTTVSTVITAPLVFYLANFI